jgi:hypothetical protein
MRQPSVESRPGLITLVDGDPGPMSRTAVDGLLRLLATRGYLTPADLNRACGEDTSERPAILSSFERMLQQAHGGWR